MARYRGPKAKVSRKFGEPIFGASRALQKKNYPPGQHGRTKRRKQSDYAVQLQEKQKAKYIYGLLERQFRNFFEKASRKSGITGEILLQMLESRLDNVVYRMGIAPSRRAARQLVIHKHITVNSEVISMPSYILKAGDLIGVREKSKSMEAIVNSLSSRGKKYPWMEWDNHLMVGRYVSIPTREEIPENIQEQLIVELYSK